jgi:hypothetical protein
MRFHLISVATNQPRPIPPVSVLSETLKAMLAEYQDSMSKRDEKKRRNKETIAAIYINLSKEAIEVQRHEAEAKRLDMAAKSRAEDNRIMIANLGTMDPSQRA